VSVSTPLCSPRSQTKFRHFIRIRQSNPAIPLALHRLVHQLPLYQAASKSTLAFFCFSGGFAACCCFFLLDGLPGPSFGNSANVMLSTLPQTPRNSLLIRHETSDFCSRNASLGSYIQHFKRCKKLYCHFGGLGFIHYQMQTTRKKDRQTIHPRTSNSHTAFLAK